jgi:hypothetical protein
MPCRYATNGGFQQVFACSVLADERRSRASAEDAPIKGK